MIDMEPGTQKNYFVKPDGQNQARLSYAVAKPS